MDESDLEDPIESERSAPSGFEVLDIDLEIENNAVDEEENDILIEEDLLGENKDTLNTQLIFDNEKLKAVNLPEQNDLFPSRVNLINLKPLGSSNSLPISLQEESLPIIGPQLHQTGPIDQRNFQTTF